MEINGNIFLSKLNKHVNTLSLFTVSERMNPNELIVKPDSKFVRIEGLRFHPIARIASSKEKG